MRILYIEDNPVDIDLTLRKFKKDAPHIEIDTARNQTEALSIMKSSRFNSYDLVLTDMHLQDGDGIAILSHVRGHSLPVAVVLLTGQGDEESAVAALKAGANDYVVKKQGYLDHLPSLLENALSLYQQDKDAEMRPLRVLYLEHDETDVDLTRRHLEKYAPHIQLEAIFNVDEFYEKFSQPDFFLQYHALLLDYRLPRENALEILEKIFSTPQQKIPTILITGRGDEEIAVKALKLGAFDYITKETGYLFKLPSVIENADYSTRLFREHQALIETEKRYRSLFEDNQLAMLLIDPANGRIVDANAAASRFYGWSGEAMRSMSLHEINTSPVDKLEDDIATVLNGEENRFLFQHLRADGSLCDVEVYTGPIEVSGRKLIYSMVYDITTRVKAQQEKAILEKQLIQAHKMEAFGQLAGGIAHDFNNILSSILGFTELALYQVERTSSLADDLLEVYAAGKRAKDLVNQILAFARQTDEDMHIVKVSSIVTEVLKLIRASTPSNIEIIKHLESSSCVMGNTVQIHQLLMNLCTNAIYAMEKDGGLLTIDLSDMVVEEKNRQLLGIPLERGPYIQLKITDTGPGIPVEIREKIFEPYFTTKPVGEGTGLGLAMVHGIVNSYGGRIWVESEPGVETAFTICIPTTTGVPGDKEVAPKTLPEGTERILFVDDEPSIVRIGSRILEKLGYTVTCYTSSLEALEAFRQDPQSFDLVITDMTMPKMTGDKLATEVIRIRQDIPVVVCSGFSKQISQETAAALGVKAFMTKPIVKADLAETVRKVLDRNQSRGKP